MLKSLTSKLVIYTFVISISPVLKPSSVQAISFDSYKYYQFVFNFYQEGFPQNGFLIGKFGGNDNNNDGYITLDDENMLKFDYESFDWGLVEIEYTADNLSSFGKTAYISTDDISYYFWEYSISSNQLRGRTAEMYSGAVVSQKETCVWVDWVDYGPSSMCSSSPLVIQALPGKNDSGNNSSTKVPEPSSTLGLLAVGALSAGSALLRRRSNK